MKPKARSIAFTRENLALSRQGLKTITRRVCRNQPPRFVVEFRRSPTDRWRGRDIAGYDVWLGQCPYAPGDILKAGETWAVHKDYDHLMPSELPPPPGGWLSPEWGWYGIYWPHDHEGEEKPDWVGRTRSPRFLPMRMRRFAAEVLSSRPEWLQDISEADIKAEGVRRCLKMNSFSGLHYEHICPEGKEPRVYGPWISLWNSINKKCGHGWERNEAVWRIQFKVREA